MRNFHSPDDGAVSKRLPPLNPLRAFEVTARHLSVSRAAAELHVTHGAVSHQIRALETALKVQLFERRGGRLALSAHGAALLPVVAGAFDSIAEAVALLTRPTTEGELVVSCVQAVASFWLVPRLGSFTERHPGVRLKLIASNDPREIYSDRVDLALVYGDGHCPDRVVEPWTDIALFPVCSPTLANSRPLREVADLANHVLLHGDDGREWNSWLAAARAPTLAYGRRHFMSNAHLALEAAINGLGVALGDTVTVSRLLADGRLIVPFDLAVPAPDAFFIVTRSELRNTPMVRAFIDWLFAERVRDEARPERAPRRARTRRRELQRAS